MMKLMTTSLALGMMVVALKNKNKVNAREMEDPAVELLDSVNVKLAELDKNFRVDSVGLYTTEEAFESARIIFASDRGNKQLGAHFVPNDTRRAWSAPQSGISWMIDTFDKTADAPIAEQDAAIRRAMQTWEDMTCSEIPLVEVTSPPSIDWGVVQFILDGGASGSPFVFADIMHCGFLPALFFNTIRPGGATSILGVAFTFIFTAEGSGTDIDDNGKVDVAFREIYYNDNFSWGIDTNNLIDIETVALHEAGHGLSQGHFGEIFRNPAGKVRFAPRAVMNAAYSGVQQELTGTDIAGHCSIWASWPEN